MILAIYGGGGAGREVLDIAGEINDLNQRWTDICFVDDVTDKKVINEAPVYTLEAFKASFSDSEVEFCIAVGEPSARVEMYERVIADGYRFATLIHPSVHIPFGLKIEDGCILCHGARVSPDVTLGENVYLQPYCSIGHDCVIGAHSVVGSFAGVAGNSVLGQQIYVGLGCMIREKLTIGSRSVLSMGAVVFRDIPEDVIAMGNPARPIKKSTDHSVF